MTGLDVAEPQPLWLSLQRTPPALGISDTLAHVAIEACLAAVGPADALVVILTQLLFLLNLLTQLVYIFISFLLVGINILFT